MLKGKSGDQIVSRDPQGPMQQQLNNNTRAAILTGPLEYSKRTGSYTGMAEVAGCTILSSDFRGGVGRCILGLLLQALVIHSPQISSWHKPEALQQITDNHAKVAVLKLYLGGVLLLVCSVLQCHGTWMQLLRGHWVTNSGH